jgi:hypothetical protein
MDIVCKEEITNFESEDMEESKEKEEEDVPRSGTSEESYTVGDLLALDRFYGDRNYSFEETTKNFYDFYALPNDCKRTRTIIEKDEKDRGDAIVTNAISPDGETPFEENPKKKARRCGDGSFN